MSKLDELFDVWVWGIWKVQDLASQECLDPGVLEAAFQGAALGAQGNAAKVEMLRDHIANLEWDLGEERRLRAQAESSARN